MKDIKPMLATALKSLNGLNPNKHWAIEQKLDGIRCFVTVDPQTKCVTYQTRSGNPLPSLALLSPVILKLATPLGMAVTLDCEATAGADFFTGVGKLRKHKPEQQDLAMLTVFDIPWIESWPCTSEVPWAVRREALEDIFCNSPLNESDQSILRIIDVLDQISTPDLLMNSDNLLGTALDSGWEGLMLKDVDAPYLSGKRSQGWIKLKPSQSFECRIIGFQPGKGRLDGAAGALLVSHLGKTVRVGNGLTDQQRQEIYDHPGLWVGKTAEVECQQLTPSGSMRHPSLVCVRWDR